MNLRPLAVGVGLCAVVAALAMVPAAAPVAASPYHPSASETYYRLDVPNGTLTVNMEATVQVTRDTPTIEFWVMQGALDVVVKKDDVALETKVQKSPVPDSPSIATATLPKPMKSGNKADFTMSYRMDPQKSEYVRMEPGAVEMVFAGQGPGSFVLVDVPQGGENYFDPGCLRASDQPADVKDAGLERWVCGEATIIALNSDNPDVLKQCAGMDDRCRQRYLDSPYNAFAQSVTDLSKIAVLEEQVQMKRGPVKLTLKYFRTDQTWANKQFAVARAAFPRLEELFGFEYPRDTVTMRQSHHIGIIGAAGIAFPDDGDVLLATDTGFDEEVTTHELAHQWAGFNLANKWVWEGLAEYGQIVLAPSLGYTPVRTNWDKKGYTDGLASWYNGSSVYDSDYWYGKAGAFFFEYEKQIGGRENMTKVLSQTARDTKRPPFSDRWFMDAGERISGANLDALFLGWVYTPETAAPLLKERRAAHDLVNALTAKAAPFALAGVPSDIQANLDAWIFGNIASQVAEADALVGTYAGVVLKSREVGLPESDGVPKAWSTKSLAAIRTLIQDQQQAIDAIVDATARLSAEAPGSPSLRELERARERFTAGDFEGASRLAASATTTAFNQVVAIKMMDIAREKQASFKPNLLSRIGLLFSDPEGDLVNAQQAYDEGDPTRSLQLARGAYEDWSNATTRGLQRLAILAGVMCLLSGGVWWLLRKTDKPLGAVRLYGPTAKGHTIGEKPATGSWRDWENTP